ncbi:uncharacterized protein LOC105282335 isoform X3 [Ooceraea biroi]|uniref:uncharacterized protein LOC105282335 isoform X3 n=1 Tax=Ooceraea biroi TaxID=2015173 RepID=UPI000F08B925|nr:uncharacterized protein LOC105282335 isoform X3 [Ooceraea biroi]
MGIEQIKVRTAINGGRLLEIGGSKSTEKADYLMAKLRDVFQTTTVKFKRVQRKAEIQVWRLDEATSEDEVIQAVAKAGNCSTEDIDTGRIKKTADGQGTLWLRLPFKSAWNVTRKRQLKIGWNTVNVTLLQKRPAQCYKCLEFGHFMANCVSGKNYSNRCFKCGDIGHIAKKCEKESKCIICKDRGMNDNHKMGDKQCKSKDASVNVLNSGVNEKTQTNADNSAMVRVNVPPPDMDQAEEMEKAKMIRSEERSFEEIVDAQVEAYHKKMAEHQTPKPQRTRRTFEKDKV